MKIAAHLILIAGLLFLSHLQAQDLSAGQPMPLFQSEDILNLDLEADFQTVFSVKDDSTYFPARLTLIDNAGLQRAIDIRIRTRGITRRQNNICRFPPLRLNFPKTATKNTPFEGQNAIKLVTHCDRADHYEENTMIEYLIYKAFNILTDSSFKVRPAFFNYIDSDKADTVRKYAFFLEREKDLAARLQGIERETEKIHPDRLDPLQTCLVDMFQYMIGNTDYSIYELHNIIIIDDSSRNFPSIPVPYDFDWSGLVSASYAVPHPAMNTEHVSERIYRGLRKEQEVVNHTIDIFNAKKQEIYQLFENFELLDSNERKKALKYLDGFFEIINNDRRVKIEFFDNARVIQD